MQYRSITVIEILNNIMALIIVTSCTVAKKITKYGDLYYIYSKKNSHNLVYVLVFWVYQTYGVSKSKCFIS